MATMNGTLSHLLRNTIVKKENGLNDTWQKLSDGLDIVFKKMTNVTHEAYVNLYTVVIDFCTYVTTDTGTDIAGEDLYIKLEEYITNHVIQITGIIASLRGEELLHRYHEEWKNFRFSSTVMSSIFVYLNKNWIAREIKDGNANVHQTFTLALVKWHEFLFMELKSYLTDALLELIQRDRDGIKISTFIIKPIIDSYVELGIVKARSDEQKKDKEKSKIDLEKCQLFIYENYFEGRFIKRTEEYYKAEASNLLQNGSVVEYMRKVEKRLEEEKNRCSSYMSESTQMPLAKTLEEVLIIGRVELFQEEFRGLLVQKKDDDIARMYKLCNRVNSGLEELSKKLNIHIANEGHEELGQVADDAFKNPKVYVDTILRVHKRYAKLARDAFGSDTRFLESLDKASADFINENAVTNKAEKHAAFKSSELLARYCDGLLRKGSKNTSDDDDGLKDVIIVFKYIKDKDVFNKQYTKLLSKRLINEQSASKEAEETMINKLKDECGTEYTSKLTKMITDKQLSEDMCVEFRGYCNEAGRDVEVDFNVIVLTTISWPSMPPLKVHLPNQLNVCHEEFRSFYTTKYSGRKLDWVLSQTRGDVAAKCFKPKVYRFLMTAAQISLIDMFNGNTSFEFSFLLQSLEMERNILSQIVGGLVKALLLKNSADAVNGDYADDIVISLNEEYTNKTVKVDMTKYAIQVDAKKEADADQKTIDEDRKHLINCCIVRILKARQRIVHNELVAEIIQQLSSRFKPKIEMIKRCTERMIEQEYMRRSEDKNDMYEYIA
ncbi:hypothetical protein WR25_11933 [Diploscapter pachys]|uniref:Cullin family profile domain-containing protein n=1 Tax=Diploscapter pachys TaxID=2018661 RepID=A0A2A2LTQ9_9BILA|nr:hypothetical protein WR25_11933 [Diploscapter pachys]